MRFLRYIPMLFLLTTLLPVAHAKDLRKRIGVGVDSQISLRANGQSTPANLSVKYTLPATDKTINVQFQLLLGLGIEENADASIVGGARFLYTVIAEDNCNVFTGVGAAYLRDGTIDPSSGVIRVQPLTGVEFFFYGLENLGFTASVGLNVDIANPLGVSLTGATFGNLGIHYYF